MSELDVRINNVRYVPNTAVHEPIAAARESVEGTLKDPPQWAIDAAYQIVTEHPWGWEEDASDELTNDQGRHVEDLAKMLPSLIPAADSRGEALKPRAAFDELALKYAALIEAMPDADKLPGGATRHKSQIQCLILDAIEASRVPAASEREVPQVIEGPCDLPPGEYAIETEDKRVRKWLFKMPYNMPVHERAMRLPEQPLPKFPPRTPPTPPKAKPPRVFKVRRDGDGIEQFATEWGGGGVSLEDGKFLSRVMFESSHWSEVEREGKEE